MAHVAKYTRAQIGGMTRHYERAQKESGEYQTFGNQDIDTNRSHLNYNLAPEREGSQLDFIQERLDEVKCHKRADVNIMCSWVITAPQGLHPDAHEKFFAESYKFLNDRYANGSEQNVVSAYVHMDEITPHMHYAFIPVVHDERKDKDKVSAKELIDRKDLSTFHSDLECHLIDHFDRVVGILNDATKDGNMSIAELKEKTATEILQATEQQAEQILRSARENASKIDLEGQARAESLQKQERALQGKIEGLERNYSGKVLTQKGLDQIQPEQGAFGAVKGVSLEDIQNLKRTALKYHDAKGDLESLKRDYHILLGEHAGLKKRVPSVQQKMKDYESIAKLKNIERVLADVAKQKPELAQVVNAISNGRNPFKQEKSRGLER